MYLQYNTASPEKSQDNFVPPWLYIKQHNQTGLKYFGKTIRKDPKKYKGSGSGIPKSEDAKIKMRKPKAESHILNMRKPRSAPAKENIRLGALKREAARRAKRTR